MLLSCLQIPNDPWGTKAQSTSPVLALSIKGGGVYVKMDVACCPGSWEESDQKTVHEWQAGKAICERVTHIGLVAGEGKNGKQN